MRKSCGGHIAHTVSHTGPIERIYRRPDLPAGTGLSIPYINELVAAGQFPKPIKLGARASGWLESEVLAWQKARIAARDAA